MNQPKHTIGVILRRINYAESDRILTVLTKDYGKVRLFAKGVRKERSKLAGGIELFSVSDIGFVAGKGDLSTLVSSRLISYYGNFLNDLNRVEFGYDCLAKINKITADLTDQYYFILIKTLLENLNQKDIDLAVIKVWWIVNLAKLTGNDIDLGKLIGGAEFNNSQKFNFDFEKGGFSINKDGLIGPQHIKYLRLCGSNSPKTLANVIGGNDLSKQLLPYMQSFIEYIH